MSIRRLRFETQTHRTAEYRIIQIIVLQIDEFNTRSTRHKIHLGDLTRSAREHPVDWKYNELARSRQIDKSNLGRMHLKQINEISIYKIDFLEIPNTVSLLHGFSI